MKHYKIDTRWVFILCISLALHISTNAQPGATDLTFGTNGFIKEVGQLDKAPFYDNLYSCQDQQGRIVVTGRYLSYYSVNGYFLIRFLPNGSIDPDFQIYNRQDYKFTPVGLKHQSDGKLILALKNEETQKVEIYRFLTDGSPDLSFGIDGKRVLLYPVSWSNTRLDVGPDDRIVVFTVRTYNNLIDIPVVYRLSSNGNPDPSFGTSGIYDLDNFTPGNVTMAVLPDHTILIGTQGYADYVSFFRLSANGPIDPTFGADGTLTYPTANDGESQSDIRILPDGQIVYAWWRAAYFSEYNVVTNLVRFSQSGIKDLTFGQDGIATSSYPVGFEQPYFASQGYLSIAADGRILTAITQLYGGEIAENMFVSAFKATGAPDNEFGVNGLRSYSFGANGLVGGIYCTATDEIRFIIQEKLVSESTEAVSIVAIQHNGAINTAIGQNGFVSWQTDAPALLNPDGVLLLPDGKYWAIADQNRTIDRKIMFAKYLSNGAPDPSYGPDGDGKIWYTFSDQLNAYSPYLSVFSQDSFLYVLCIRSDPQQYALLKFKSDGTLDPGFGNAGVKLFPASQEFYILLVRPDGRPVLGGYKSSPNPALSQPIVVQLSPQGASDPTFGTSGTLNIPPVNGKYVLQMALQPNGDLLTGICPNDYGYESIALLRYHSNGVQDLTFGNNGKVDVNWDAYDHYTSIITTASGQILGLGSNNPQGTSSDSEFVFRYLENGQPDSTFGTNGRVDFYMPEQGGSLLTMMAQPNGKIVVNGYYNTYDYDYKALLATLNADGSLDEDFGNQGWVYDYVSGHIVFTHFMCYQPDGKIVTQGVSIDLTGFYLVLARIYADDAVAVHSPGFENLDAQIWPNPLTDNTFYAAYTLSDAAEIQISLYNTVGQQLQILYSGSKSAGNYTDELQWPEQLPTGVYLCRIRAGLAEKMIPFIKQ